MNRVYRLVRNAKSNTIQVASEAASSRGMRGSGQPAVPLRPLAAGLIALGMAGGATPALAQVCSAASIAACSAQGGSSAADRAGIGGAGNGQGGGARRLTTDPAFIPVSGGAFNNGVGGAGATGTDDTLGNSVAGGGGGGLGVVSGSTTTGGRGNDGQPDSRVPSGGGGGGTGLYADSSASGVSVLAGAAVIGGAGGTGGAPTPASGVGGGGGGGGGAGIAAFANSILVDVGVGSAATGGAGGAGGSGEMTAQSFGGGGGGGGDGVLLTGTSMNFHNAGAVTGGAGGAGGDGFTIAGGGGDGGDGVRAFGSGTTVTNYGAIIGGQGGAPGNGPLSGATVGAAGAGVRATTGGLTVVNYAVIRGGDAIAGGAAGPAVVLQGSGSIQNAGELSGGMGPGGRAPAVIFNGITNQLVVNSASLVRGVLQVNNAAEATVTVLANNTTALDGVQLNGGQLSLQANSGTLLDLGAPIKGTGQVSAIGPGAVALQGATLTGTINLGNTGGVRLSGATQTSGSQHYSLAAQVVSDTTIVSSAGTIGFDGTVDGAHSLSVQSPLIAVFGDAVGAATPLTALTVNTQRLSAAGSIAANQLSVTTSTPITQQGAYTVSGPSSFTATGSDVTLTNAGNDFGGAMQINARNASVVSQGGLNVASLAVTQDIDLTAGGLLQTSAASVAGHIHLNGAQIQAGALTANEIAVTASSGMMLNNDVTSATTLALQSTGSIMQTGGSITAATLTANLAGGNLILNAAGNAIGEIGALNAGAVDIASTVPMTVTGPVIASSLNLVDTQGVTVTGSLTGAAAQVASGTSWTIGNGGPTGALAADTVVDGTLAYNRAGDASFSNALSGNGQLVQRGTGRLLFDGDGAAFSGVTDVQSGGLVVGSTAGSGAVLGGSVTVASGASLAGHGRITGNATLANGAILSPGNSIGTLTVDGDFSMASGTRMDAELGATGLGDKVVVGGNLALNGVTLNVSDAGGLGPGVYTIFSYGGTLTETNGGIAFGSLPGGHTLQLQTLTGDKQINIVDVTNTTLQYWNANHLADPTRMGGGSGTWSVTSPVWTDGNGSITAAMAPQPGFAVFGGASGLVTVDGGAGAVSATGMQFKSDGYRLSGAPVSLVSAGGSPVINVGDGSQSSAGYTATIDAILDGTQGLNKTGAGTLVLNGLNTYSGGAVISGGAIAVADDRNLGNAANGVALQGGNLRITGTSYTATTRAVTLQPGGAIDIAEAGNVFSWNGTIGGTGALVKRGAGTLVLNGATSYTGGTTVAEGTLQGNSATLRGDIVNNAALVFAQDTDGSYTGTMSGTGALTKQGAGVLTLAGANTYTGGTTVSAGTLAGDSASLQGNIANNATVIFNQLTDGGYGGALSGNGTLLKQGAGTLAINGDGSAYTGATQVRAGGLEVNGRLGGSLAVAGGTTLSGTGSVGDTLIDSGATLSPGNAATPVASLTVNGNLTFAPGATYRADTTIAGAHDSVHVTGAANLAGSVVDVGENGTYTASTSYRLLTADGGLNGRFDSVTSNLAFLTPSLNYDANNVDLLMQLKQTGGGQSIGFADAARTRNQRATARGLQSLPTGNALYTRVLNLPQGAPPAVFDALSGEVHASTATILQGVADNVATLPLAHLRANLDAGLLPGAPTAQLAAPGAASGAGALPRPAAQPLWAQLFGNWRTIDGTGNTAKVKDTDSGLFVGGDHGLAHGWRVGGALGYTNSDIDVRQRDSTSDVDSYSAALYGGKAFEAGAGKINFSVGAAYTWHDIRTKRNADAAGASQTLKASYHASTAQIFSELGYAVPLDDRITIEPFIGASYSDLRTRGFSESGGDAALSGGSTSNKLGATTLGLHARTTFESAGAQGVLHGTLAWRHAYGDVTPDTTLAFNGGQSFTVTGAPIARDAAVLQLGIDMALSKRTTVGLLYGGQFGDGNKQNAGTLDIRHRF